MKKLISMMLALMMVLSLVPTALAAETQSPVEKFTDVPANASYYDALEYAVHNGYISGTSATTFSPDTYLTRAQFVTVLGRMMGVSNVSGVTKFKDVPSNAWYAPYVAWAANLGVVSGTSATQFSPDSILTVEQLGVMLARYINATGAKAEVQQSNVQYADKSRIASWAADSMETMRQYGIILPDARGNVNPQSQVKRSDGVVALVAFAKALGMGEEFEKEEPVVEPPVVTTEPTEPVEPPLKPIDPGVDPIQQGTILSGIGITAKDLVPASWNNVNQFVWPHNVDDFETACSNMIYMYTHNKSTMTFTMSSDYDYSSLAGYNSLYDAAGDAVVGAFGCSGVFSADKVYSQSYGHWENGVYIPGSYSTVVKVTISLSNTSRMKTVTQDAVDRACEIHDELWRSGKITDSMTQKEKAWAYFAWMANNVEYDYDFVSKNSSNAYGALLDGYAICEGYADGYSLLLLTEGIESYRCESPAMNHACNLVLLDGELVGVDSTYSSTVVTDYYGMNGDVSATRFAMTMSEFASLYTLPDYLQLALRGHK